MLEKKLNPDTNSRLTFEMLPKFEGSMENLVTKVIDWMNERLEIKKWTDQEIETKFARRSASEILTDGDVGYMNPCSDLTLVAYALLKKNNLNPVLVAEVLKQEGRAGVRMHFALEFKSNKEDKLWSLEFVSKNLTTLKSGEYHNDRTDVTTLRTVRVNEPIDFIDNIRKVLLGAGFRDQDIDLQAIISGFKKDNTDETFTKYQRDLGDNKKLYLDMVSV